MNYFSETKDKTLCDPKEFNPQRAVKALIASNFHRDGILFIKKYDLVRESQDMCNKNFLAKAVIDLAMSIECSLKSLIISLSPDTESPKDAYKAARNYNHKLKDLHDEVSKRAKNRLKLPKKNNIVFENLCKLGIGSRYSHDIWLIRFQRESGKYYLGDNLISKTLGNSDWENKVREDADKFSTLAETAYSRFLSKHGTKFYGNRYKLYEKELEQFLK